MVGKAAASVVTAVPQLRLPAPAATLVAGRSHAWQVLSGGARGYALLELVRRHAHPWIVLAPDDGSARACLADCRCFDDLPAGRLVYLPDTEILPYDPEPAAPSIVRERAVALNTLYRWPEEPALLITTAPALARRLAGPEHWVHGALRLRVGARVERAALRAQLHELGYQPRAKVRYPGEYAEHPLVVDLFTTGHLGCLRLRFEADALVAIEPLQPDSQRTTGVTLDALECLPAREVPITAQAAARFERGWRNVFGRALSDPSYERIAGRLGSAPIEALLPLFVESTTILADWLPARTGIYCLPGARAAAVGFIERAALRFAELRHDPARRLLPPEASYLTKDELDDVFAKRPVIEERPDGDDLGLQPTGLSRQATLDDALAALAPFFERAERLLLCVQTDDRAEGMALIAEMLGRPAEPVDRAARFFAGNVPVGLVRADVDQGFRADALGITMLTEAEIFGQPIVQRDEAAATATAAEVVADLSLIEPGDPLVHARYGVGRFAGLELLKYGSAEQHLVMAYADDARIFVKMEDLDLVMRYHGLDAADAPLDAVGDSRWKNGLREAVGHAEGTARQLLRVYAERAARRGLVCDPPGFSYEKFCRAFPFRETRDQRAAVADVIADLTAQRPMDRVVSGDVGFGKTEVAMRAAFLAAYSGYQVMLMVPTTLLAQQHHDTFRRRFAEFPFRIELLTRSSQDTPVLRDLAEGAVDIVIGTQRLLQSDVRLPRFGLLVIDEEHRFGVREKERLARLRAEVNVLSLTATPIPRTLSLAMHGIRDISIIATPPAKRLSIRTIVADLTPELIREAIDRERLRGGQVFYLHNTIRSIEEKADEIRALLPEARVERAHGRMSDAALEDVMRRFHAHDFDVLVCTTIIEIGIDIPNANTMLIEDADQFGLAQLHQLRGRVGRAQRQAYCYLLKSGKADTERSRRRLRAMERTAGLGEGLVLAHHDLEIRGAGELLGEAQAGDIQAIGFQLYQRLLEAAIAAVREGDEASVPALTEGHFDLPIEGELPDSYIASPAIRLSILSRLAGVIHPEELEALREELQDRFGPLPPPAERLLELGAIRFPLRAAGVQRMSRVDPRCYRLSLTADARAACDLLARYSVDQPARCEEIDRRTYLVRLGGDDSATLLRAAAAFVDAVREGETEGLRRGWR